MKTDDALYGKHDLVEHYFSGESNRIFLQSSLVALRKSKKEVWLLLNAGLRILYGLSQKSPKVLVLIQASISSGPDSHGRSHFMQSERISIYFRLSSPQTLHNTIG